MEHSVAELTKFFEFLDHLRESGATNMYGAAPWIKEEFGLDREAARTVVMAWMKLDIRTPPEERAKIVLETS